MDIDRRSMRAIGGGAAALGAIGLPGIARAEAPFEQPPLLRAEDALAPVISGRTVGLHSGTHHRACFDSDIVPGTAYADMTLGEVVAESGRSDDRTIFQHAAQAWNHVVDCNRFEGGPVAPEGAFAEAVERDFGGPDGLKEAMVDAAGGVFGTGWVLRCGRRRRAVAAGSGGCGQPAARWTGDAHGRRRARARRLPRRREPPRRACPRGARRTRRLALHGRAHGRPRAGGGARRPSGAVARPPPGPTGRSAGTPPRPSRWRTMRPSGTGRCDGARGFDRPAESAGRARRPSPTRTPAPARRPPRPRSRRGRPSWRSARARSTACC